MSDYAATFVQPLLDDPHLGACAYTSLARLLSHVRERRLEAGDTLYSRGAEATHAFLIVEGELGCSYPQGIQLRLQCGLCGEEAAGEVGRYQADAVALTPLRVLAIPRRQLQSLAASQPAFRAQMQHLLLAHMQGQPAPAPSVPAPSAAGEGSWGHVAGWACVLLLPPLVFFFGAAWGLPEPAIPFAAIFSAVVAMWVFSLVDDYVPGLFALFAILVFGLAPPAKVLAGFASDGFFLALSILGLGTVLTASGLSYRFLLGLLRRLPARPVFQDFGLLLTGALLTPLIPSSNARVALVAPLLADMQDLLRYPGGGRAATRLSASAFAGATALSAVFLTSKSVNFVVFGLLSHQDREQFQWLHWLSASLVLGAAMLAIHVLTCAWMFRGGERPHFSAAQLEAQLALLGPLKAREWAALAGVGVFLAGVATASFHKLQPPWLALAILYGLLALGFLRKSEFKEKLDWPFLMYQGGLVGVMAGFYAAGLDTWLAGQMSWFGGLMRHEFELFVLLLFAALFVIRLAVPINAAVVIAATLFMPLADVQGVNPWVVGIVILTLGEMWFFPYQCSYYLQFRDGAQRHYEERAFLRYSALQNLGKLAAVYLSLPYWRWLGLL